MDALFGFIWIALIAFFVVSLFSPKQKSPRRRKQNYSRNYSRPTYPRVTERTPRKYSGKSYVNNPDPNTFMVYFLENQRLGALKLGVGSWGRINEFLDARVAPNYSAESAGWNLLRAARFSTAEHEYDTGRENAYEAERRAHFYWRYVKRLPRHVEKEQMGFSEIEVLGVRRFEQTKGYTETVGLGLVCESTTWNYVLKTPGFKSEYVPEGARVLTQIDLESLSSSIPDGYLDAQIKRIRHESDTPSRTQITDEERFWSKVQKTESCWLWTGTKTNTGYGLGYLSGKLGPAHRMAWTIEIGSDPGLYFMENECGQRSCVNPQHWGISLRRKSAPGEIRVSEFTCTNEGCNRPSKTMTQPGLCEPCRQVEKRKRRKARKQESDLCDSCGLPIERRGSPSGVTLCTNCRS